MKMKTRYNRVNYTGEYSSILSNTQGSVYFDMGFGAWVYIPDGIEEEYVLQDYEFIFTQDSEV